MKSNYKMLGEFIRQVDVRNTEGTENNLLGVSVQKRFMPSIANTVGTDFSKYKVVKRGQFTYIPDTSRRGDKIGIALLDSYDEGIVSNIYTVFEIIDTNKLIPEYLMLWFSRPEFDRYARYKSHGSVREIFDWDEMCKVELPVPPIEKQAAIVKQYKTIADRIALKQRINDNLVAMLQFDYQKLLNGYTTDSENLPMNWEVGTIGAYCDVKSGYAFKSEWWTNEGVRVIKIANIVNNTIAIDDCNCVAEEHTHNASQFFVKSGDVLIAMTGATTGKVGIVPYVHNSLVVNQRVGKFFLGEHPLEKTPFLFSTLLFDNVSRQLRPDGTAGSAQDNLSPDDIKNIAIIIPAHDSLDSFNDSHIPHMELLMQNSSEIFTLNKVLDLVLQTISCS